jgi:hypothetical protein
MSDDEDVDYGDCDNCKVAVLGGLTLDLCEQSGKFTTTEKLTGVSCRSLRKKFERDEITPVELIKAVRPRLSGEDKERLDEVIKVAKDSGIELKGLEDDAE